MVSIANTVTSILTILKSEPFRRFSTSDLHTHLPTQSLPDLQAENLLQKAMVELYEGTEQEVIGEGIFRLSDGSPIVKWLS